MKSKKTALLNSIVSLILCVSMLLGTTSPGSQTL